METLDMRTTRPPGLLVLTGGGTAGHVLPQFPVIDGWLKHGGTVAYIGSRGIERQLVQEKGVDFYQVPSGKLRRYFSLRTFADFFKVFYSILVCTLLLIRLRPVAVMSKGGFVSVPVVLAARIVGIPVFCHESDLTPGLATKIAMRVARKVFYSFPESKKYFSSTDSACVGALMRPELLTGSSSGALSFLGLSERPRNPVLLIMGGSSGAEKLNAAMRDNFEALCSRFFVIHLTGKGKSLGLSHPHYRSFEYIGAQMKDLYALCDLVVSRAGSNSIFELLALRKPMLLIPLEAGSRGDQVENADSFLKQGWAKVLREDFAKENLLSAVLELQGSADTIRNAQNTFVSGSTSGVAQVVQTLLDA